MIREIRKGRIQVAGEIQSFKGSTVSFADGRERNFDAVVLATGFRPALPPILSAGNAITNESISPTSRGVETGRCGL